MNDETLIKCFEMEKRLKQLGSDDNEIADAKIAFVKGKSIEECELEAFKKVEERRLNSFKESYIEVQMQIRHKYVRELAMANSFLKLKGTLKANDGFEYKFKEDTVAEYKNGQLIKKFREFY